MPLGGIYHGIVREQLRNNYERSKEYEEYSVNSFLSFLDVLGVASFRCEALFVRFV